MGKKHVVLPKSILMICFVSIVSLSVIVLIPNANATPPLPVTSPTATQINTTTIKLGWANPADTSFQGTTILRNGTWIINATGQKDYFQFNTTLANIQNSTHTLTTHGTPAYDTGIRDRSLKFDGTQYYTMPLLSNINWNKTHSWSINVWVNASASSTGRDIILTDESGGGINGWRLEKEALSLSPNQVMRFTYGTSETSIDGCAIHPNVWYDLAVVSDGTNIKLYCNGVQNGTGTITSEVLSTNTESLSIGDFSGGAGNRWVGVMDEMRLFSGYETQKAINNVYTDTVGKGTSLYDLYLGSSKLYNYQICSVGYGGQSTTCPQVSLFLNGIPAPTAPVLSKANTQSSTGITPSWSASSGATFYLVKRASPAGTSFSQIANVSSLSYADSGLTPGDQYQYEIIAGNSSGTSSASNMKSNYTSNVAPTSLVASLITYLSERTTWTNPTGNSSSFKIEDATGTCSSYSTVTSDTGNTTNKYDLTGLTGNTKVCVRVSTNFAKGTNSSGTSSPSSVLNFYTLPAPPTGLTITQLVSKQAHLSWTAPSDNGTVLGYFIEFSTNGGSTWSTAIANTGNSTTHFDHAGLTAGLTYTYRVSTIQYSGTSVPSATASKLIFQGIIINAFESDGTTPVSGNLIQSNSTSKNNVFTLVQGTIGLNGLLGNQNFTIKDSNNFVVFKAYNFNSTSTGSASYSTHIYRVDCPSDGTGNDAKIEVNETDGHRVSSSNAPVCDSNNLATFSNAFTGNGNSPLSYSSSLLVTILNSTFNANPTSFTVNSISVGTSYNSATEVATSPSFVIGSGLQTFSETFSLQLNKVITLSGVGSIGGGGSVGYQSLGSSPVSPNNTSQLNTINPPRMTAKFATNPMTGKFGQLLNGTMTLTWQNSKNLIVNSISVGDYVRWIFYPNQPFNLIGDTIYQNSATAYVADIPFNVQVPAMSCQLNMTASLGCAENNNQYDIPVKLNISVNGQQYVISSTLSVIVSNSPVSNPIVAYSVIGVISVLVLFALFRTKGGKPKRTSKYSKNENDLGKSKTAKELDKVLKKKK